MSALEPEARTSITSGQEPIADEDRTLQITQTMAEDLVTQEEAARLSATDLASTL